MIEFLRFRQKKRAEQHEKDKELAAKMAKKGVSTMTAAKTLKIDSNGKRVFLDSSQVDSSASALVSIANIGTPEGLSKNRIKLARQPSKE